MSQASRCLVVALEPVLALFGAAVGEALGGVDAEAVVADRGGGVEALRDVAVAQEVPLEGGVGPDAGEAVGLELLAHGQLVGPVGVVVLQPADLVVDAQQVLDVVAELVGEDVGLGEVPRRAEAVGQLPEEAEVDVRLLSAGQ